MPQDNSGRCRTRSLGFTLIEMLVALAIVGILAALAVSAYDAASSRTHRAAAAACLGQAVTTLERERAATLAYPTVLPTVACTSELEGQYRFAGEVGGETFRLIAEPLGRQARADSGCNCTLTLDEGGRKGTAPGDPACAGDARVAACW